MAYNIRPIIKEKLLRLKVEDLAEKEFNEMGIRNDLLTDFILAEPGLRLYYGARKTDYVLSNAPKPKHEGLLRIVLHDIKGPKHDIWPFHPGIYDLTFEDKPEKENYFSHFYPDGEGNVISKQVTLDNIYFKVLSDISKSVIANIPDAVLKGGNFKEKGFYISQLPGMIEGEK